MAVDYEFYKPCGCFAIKMVSRCLLVDEASRA